MKSCLICDDHAMMLDALSGVVALGWPDVKIVQATDYPSAWAAAAAPLDLIISDLVMPGAAPLEGIRRLQAVAPGSPILVVTANEEDALLIDLFDLGIAGFAPKTSKSTLIEAAIRLILAGGRYVPPRIVQLVSRRPDPGPLQTPRMVTARLTERQIDVLKLSAQGRSNKEIARVLDLSPTTIKAHVAAAITALGASNRTEAVSKAQGMGLI